MYVCVCIYIYI